MNVTIHTKGISRVTAAALAIHLGAACAAHSRPAGCTNESSPIDVVRAQEHAYNAHDVAAFASCYAQDSVVEDLSGTRAPIHGVQELKKAYAWLGDAPAAFHAETLGRVVEGSIVVSRERLVGGREGWPTKAIVVYEVLAGKITRVWFPPVK